jgi:hypothetical protein
MYLSVSSPFRGRVREIKIAGRLIPQYLNKKSSGINIFFIIDFKFPLL